MTTTETPEPAISAQSAPAALAARCGDCVVLPGDPAYDRARMPWNVAVDQRPAAVATPRTAEDVQAVVRAASALGLRVAPQSTGHSARALAQHDLSDVVLLRTDRLDDVTVDAGRRVAHIGGGAIWEAVVEAAGAHGLAAQHGSSPDVGVAGYLLGGGLSWYGRSKGLACNDIVAIDLVRPDGELVRASRDEQQELFWALRGGRGNFGIVVGFELRLHPVTDVYAGLLLWDISHLERVLRHWVAWCGDAPDQVTTSLRVLRFPLLPHLPEFLRGRQVVVVDGVVLDDDAVGERLLAGFRALDPEMDTFGRTAATSLIRLHMDPEGPTPSVDSGTLLRVLDEAGIASFVRSVGPRAQTSLLMAELRQLGGALARPVRDGGVVGQVDAAYAAFFVAVAATPEMAAAGAVDAERTQTALADWETGQRLLNLVPGPVDLPTAYGPTAWARLCELRGRLDPDGVLLADHEVVPDYSPAPG